MSTIGSGSSGQLGSIWEVQNNRRNSIAALYGGSSNVSFSGYLSLTSSNKDMVLDEISTSIQIQSGDYDGQLLDWTASAWTDSSADDVLFQSSGTDFYTNIDFDTGTYSVIDEQTFSESLGMDWSGGKPYDMVNFCNNTVNFYDFVFSGTGDGTQDSVSLGLNELTNVKWGITTYNLREVDTGLLQKAISGTSDSSYEQSKAGYTLYLIQKSLPNWANDEIKESLSMYTEGTEEYNEKFIELATKVMDQEGYTEGKTVDTPTADDDVNSKLKETSSEGFTAVRGKNGQVRAILNNVEDVNVDGAGKITGSATFSLGETKDEEGNSYSVVQVGQTRDNSEMNLAVSSGALTNMEVYGENANLSYSERAARTYNLQMDASNSTVDATRGTGNLYVTTSEEAENDTFKLGDAVVNTLDGFDNVVVDKGKNNTFISKGNSANMFITKETSESALMFGGDGANEAVIGGNNGVYVGGSGSDTVTTMDGSKNNIIATMDGDDVINDYGAGNLVAGGAGKDTLNVAGSGLLANLGNDEDYEANIIGGHANYVFATDEYKYQDGNGNPIETDPEYYEQYLNNYLTNAGITIEQLRERLNIASDATVEQIVQSLKGNNV